MATATDRGEIFERACDAIQGEIEQLHNRSRLDIAYGLQGVVGCLRGDSLEDEVAELGDSKYEQHYRDGYAAQAKSIAYQAAEKKRCQENWHASLKADGQKWCTGCEKVVSIDVCGCGTEERFHTIGDGHFFIPMGCDCHRAK